MFKKNAIAACPTCDYKPESEYEVARSLILSKNFTVGELVIGRSLNELRAIAEEIRGGRPYYFDPNEQQLVVEAYRTHVEIKSKRLTLNFVKWLGPLLLILGLLAVLLWSR